LFISGLGSYLHLLYSTPLNDYTPKIQNSKKMNIIKMTAFPRAGSDASNELISFFILGNALMDLRGLNTLNVLKALRLEPPMPGIYSITPTQTTAKSNQFQ
jgi:hypothetical protein